MSHSVTITRTVTTSNTSSTLVVNTGYLKTLPGLLKLVQLILGGVSVGLVAWYYNNTYGVHTPSLFFLLMATTFLIGTFCLLVSCLFSLSTGGIISKTIYELIYHSIGAILLIAASITLLIHVNKYGGNVNEKYMIAAIIGLINGCLYVASAVLARRSYRGI